MALSHDILFLFRQFQSRLVRSKLAMARIMGNKGLEKELRSKSLGGLHTDVVAEEDYGFLTKLEHRPCTANQYIPQNREISHGQENLNAKRQTSKETNASFPDKSVNEHVRPRNLLRASTTLGATTLGSKKTLDTKTPPQALQKMYTDIDKPPKRNIMKKLGADNEEVLILETNANSEKGMQKQRPKTVTIVTESPEVSPLPSPRQYSRRASKAADFFEEDKKIDMVELRLKAARSLDYTDRVQQFCEELEEMGSGEPHVDYYSLRLQASLGQEPAKRDLCLRGSSEDEDNREVGNVHVRSLTLPKLDLKFNDEE